MLRQGLARRWALLAALACAAFDTVLITLGVLGVGGLLARHPTLVTAGTLLGAAFLTWYGLRSLRAALKADHAGLHAAPGGAVDGTVTAPARVIGTAAAFSLLNPHALLDTVVLIGGASAGLSGSGRTAFLLGTVLASWAWFFTLAVAGRALAPVMARPRAWRVLDLLIGATLLLTAAGLLRGL
ncbi:LysE family transporter [Deinococcus sp.]|uniref:LysE/ArgO family amino acid transporter n=1 Tax=Deinococcus sp. TaxID=47478 RepID=UPI0025B827F4|nr:LysE family transporter [Deinococcus sp.]